MTPKSVTQLPIHDTTNEWIPTKIQQVITFSNMTLGAKYCDIPHLTLPSHKYNKNTVLSLHVIIQILDLDVESVESTPIQIYTSLKTTTVRIVQKASTANTNSNTSPCHENHVARSFVVHFWNFDFYTSQSYQSNNQQQKTQQKNGI